MTAPPRHDPTLSRPGYADPEAARLVAPAAARNAAPIAAALARLLAGSGGTVLEIGAGTGQHAVACAAALPHLTWAPSDPDPRHVASIAAWREAEGGANLAAPMQLDATDDWPAAVALTLGRGLRAVFCANVIHIAPWAVAEGLIRGAARALAPGGPLILYGPFREGGGAAPSNLDFDAALKARSPDFGLRDLEAVAALAAAHGLDAPERTEMPANNLLLAFRRPR